MSLNKYVTTTRKIGIIQDKSSNNINWIHKCRPVLYLQIINEVHTEI